MARSFSFFVAAILAVTGAGPAPAWAQPADEADSTTTKVVEEKAGRRVTVEVTCEQCTPDVKVDVRGKKSPPVPPAPPSAEPAPILGAWALGLTAQTTSVQDGPSLKGFEMQVMVDLHLDGAAFLSLAFGPGAGQVDDESRLILSEFAGLSLRKGGWSAALGGRHRVAVKDDGDDLQFLGGEAQLGLTLGSGLELGLNAAWGAAWYPREEVEQLLLPEGAPPMEPGRRIVAAEGTATSLAATISWRF